MPDRYNFKCRDCGFIEFRYRNVKRCRKCNGLVDAQKPLTYAELQSTITAQEDIIKRLRELLKETKEDGQNLYKNLNKILEEEFGNPEEYKSVDQHLVLMEKLKQEGVE